MKPKIFNFGLTNSFALGIACDTKQLQIAFICLLIEFNFNLVIDGVKRFIDCLKSN